MFGMKYLTDYINIWRYKSIFDGIDASHQYPIVVDFEPVDKVADGEELFEDDDCFDGALALQLSPDFKCSVMRFLAGLS